MQKFKYLPLAFFVSLIFLACATNNSSSANNVSASVVNERHIEADGGFSILLPESWEAMEWPGLKYKIIIGPVEYEFSPNINFVDENYFGPLDKYVDACVEALNDLSQFELIQRNEFVTTKNLKGEEVIIHSLQNERYFRQIFYIFSGKYAKKLLVTCTVPIDAGNSYDDLFNKILKTFEWIN